MYSFKPQIGFNMMNFYGDNYTGQITEQVAYNDVKTMYGMSK
jgi:hypothetical protein